MFSKNFKNSQNDQELSKNSKNFKYSKYSRIFIILKNFHNFKNVGFALGYSKKKKRFKNVLEKAENLPFLQNIEGKSNGDGFILLPTEEDALKALGRHKVQ